MASCYKKVKPILWTLKIKTVRAGIEPVRSSSSLLTTTLLKFLNTCSVNHLFDTENTYSCLQRIEYVNTILVVSRLSSACNRVIPHKQTEETTKVTQSHHTSFFASKKPRRCLICQKPTVTNRRVCAIAHHSTRWLVLSLVSRNRSSRHCSRHTAARDVKFCRNSGHLPN